MKVFVTRHGQTSWNALGKIQGKTDIELNETGKNQARETGEAIKNEHIDIIISSPLKRAKETAQIINKNFNVEITAEGRVTSITKNITYVYPIFTGFNSATTFAESLVEVLTKLGLRSSLGTITDTKINSNISNYYWIISPYKVNNVVTSGISIISDFIYTTVEYKGTTYHCYRLNAPSSADTFTFTIS